MAQNFPTGKGGERGRELKKLENTRENTYGKTIKQLILLFV